MHPHLLKTLLTWLLLFWLGQVAFAVHAVDHVLDHDHGSDGECVVCLVATPIEKGGATASNILQGEGSVERFELPLRLPAPASPQVASPRARAPPAAA